MKTLLFIQTNSAASKQTKEYVLALAKDLDVKVKFIHIHYPDILQSASMATNMELFQSPEIQENYIAEEVQKNETDMLELKKEGKIDAGAYFEYFTGVPEIILKSKFIKGDFDMLAVYNNYIRSSLNTNLSLKSIIKSISCPIWVIPDQKYNGLGSALYATDYQEQDINSIKLLIGTTKEKLQNITFVHLTDRVDFIQTIKNIGFQTYVKQKTDFSSISGVVLDTQDNKTIPEYIEEAIVKQKCNFIVALKENKNLFQQVFYRSFTTKLLKNIDELVLILHTEDALIEEENNDEIPM